MRPQMKWGSN